MRGRIVLAATNEARAIGPVLQEIDEARSVLSRGDVTLDVLLVDAGSSDATVDVAKGEADRLGITMEIVKAGGSGLVPALLEGLARAVEDPGVSFVVTLDAGGQHDARQIPDLVRAHLARGNGITIGSRWTRGGSSPGTSAVRAAASRVANTLVRRIAGLDDVHDATTSFRVLDPEVVGLDVPAEAQAEMSCYFASLTTLAQVEGFAIDEVPIHFRPRYSGVSRLTREEGERFVAGLRATRAVAARRREDLHHDQTAWAKRQRHFAGQAAAADSHFGALDELMALSDANRFFGWIVDSFGAAIGPRTVDVGAGLGTVSRAIVQRHPDVSVLAIEPAANVYPRLAGLATQHERIETRQVTSSELLAAGNDRAFDTAVYVNVLEHIEDDRGELDVARRLLAPGGHLCVLVPAMPSLYSRIDHKSGHYRRYTKESLRRKVTDAGFTIASLEYFDVASVVPYWLVYTLLGVENLGGASNSLFDNVLVPISMATQKLLRHPPLGKNLLLVARA